MFEPFPIPQDAEAKEFLELCDVVHKASGIKIEGGKQALVRARLLQRMSETGAGSIAEYLRRVRADATGTETAVLLDLISTNVTSFFRERHHFDHLAKVVLPEYLASGSSEPMRVWSAACSSGEEPYSIAMTLGEALGPERLWRFLVLATDISTRMISRARRAGFPHEGLAPVPLAWRDRWFEGGAGEERFVATSLRERVRANHLNLLEPWPMKRRFSAIFCRNALIYFDRPTCQHLVRRFWDQLLPGGFLYIGHSESLSQVDHAFEYAGPTIYRKPSEEDVA